MSTYTGHIIEFGGSTPTPPGPSAPHDCLNRVYNTTISDYWYWKSPEPDQNGTYYDGPGTYGVNTQNYMFMGKAQ